MAEKTEKEVKKNGPEKRYISKRDQIIAMKGNKSKLKKGDTIPEIFDKLMTDPQKKQYFNYE